MQHGGMRFALLLSDFDRFVILVATNRHALQRLLQTIEYANKTFCVHCQFDGDAFRKDCYWSENRIRLGPLQLYLQMSFNLSRFDR